jgi:hypothetical protein
VFRQFAGMSPSDLRRSNGHPNGLKLVEKIRRRTRPAQDLLRSGTRD